MGTTTAQPEPLDENGQAFADIRTLSEVIERGEVADSPNDQYIPPTMAEHIENTGSDAVNNAAFNFMSQLPPYQNENGENIGENIEKHIDEVPPTQIPATVVDRPGEVNRDVNETVPGPTVPTEIETDNVDDALVENGRSRSPHGDPHYPFPPVPPLFVCDPGEIEIEELGNTLVENRSDALPGDSFDPSCLQGVTSVVQWPDPLPPGLQRGTDSLPPWLQRSSSSPEWYVPECRRYAQCVRHLPTFLCSGPNDQDVPSAGRCCLRYRAVYVNNVPSAQSGGMDSNILAKRWSPGKTFDHDNVRVLALSNT